MAHRVARAALRLRVQPCSRCSAYRSFSTSTARRKDDSENLAASLRSERSIASQMKHALESAQDLGNIPSDFGFLPGMISATAEHVKYLIAIQIRL
jgi:hypothetical protein